MSSRIHLESLLAGVAEAAGIDTLTLDADDQLLLSHAGGIVLVLDYVELEQRVVLSADLGSVPEENELRFLARLLELNALWQETDGLMFARDPRSGAVLIMRSAHLAQLDFASFEALLLDFAERALAWTKIVASGVAPSPRTDVTPSDEPLFSLQTRV